MGPHSGPVHRPPQKAVTEADALLARLAGDRGFPGEQFEEQFTALSVHHAAQVPGYRNMRTAARGQSGTEEIREAMVEARGLRTESVCLPGPFS